MLGKENLVESRKNHGSCNVHDEVAINASANLPYSMQL